MRQDRTPRTASLDQFERHAQMSMRGMRLAPQGVDHQEIDTFESSHHVGGDFTEVGGIDD